MEFDIVWIIIGTVLILFGAFTEIFKISVGESITIKKREEVSGLRSSLYALGGLFLWIGYLVLAGII